MNDIETAQELVKKTAGEMGMERSDFDKACAMLESYGKERASLLRDMTEMLDRSDTSGVRSDWKEKASKGKDLFLTLDRNIPSIQLAYGSLGMAGIGLAGFRDGEQDIWDKVVMEEIAISAEAIQLIGLACAGIVEECNEKIRTIQDDDKGIQEATRGIFNTTTSGLFDLGNVIWNLVSGARTKHSWDGAEGPVAPIKGQITEDFKSYLELARKKTALKQELAKRIIYIDQAKEKIGYYALDEAYSRGETFAGSLANGETGNGYEAADWKEFGKQCKEKLQNGRGKSQEKTKKLFETLYPALRDYLNKSYLALTDDPALVQAWQNQMEKLFADAQAAIEKQKGLIEALKAGPFAEAGIKTLTSSSNIVGACYQEFKEHLKAVQTLIESVKW